MVPLERKNHLCCLVLGPVMRLYYHCWNVYFAVLMVTLVLFLDGFSRVRRRANHKLYRKPPWSSQLTCKRMLIPIINVYQRIVIVWLQNFNN